MPATRPLLTAGAVLLATTAIASAQTTLMRGNDVDPSSLDHHQTSNTSEAHILRDLYEGLVTQDAEANVIPGAAESWEISDDGTVYTFTLREDGRWSNGDPVTANDFAFAFRRIMDPATAAGYASILYDIENAEAVNAGEMPVEELGVTALDDRTLEIKLRGPTPYFLELLTHQTGKPLHQASVEEHGDAFTQPGNMVTNGAYMLESFVPNDRIVLQKNPEFFDAANVAIETIHYIPFEDRAACVRRFEAGEVHICSDLPAEQMAYLEENFPGEVRVPPYLGVYYLPVSVANEELSDPRVRQAISMVIDREFIAEEVWQGTMMPAYSLIPPGTANYVEDAPQLEYAETDLLDREDAAIALLEEAGVEPGTLDVEMRYNSSENHRNTLAAIADMLTNIGIGSSLVEMEGSNYFDYLQQGGEFELARAGWIGDYNDPQNFLYLNQTGVSFNYPRWSNEEYDARMSAAAETIDLEERAEILAEAERIFLEELPSIPVLHYSSHSLVADEIAGWEDNIMNNHATRWMSFN